MRLEAYHVCLQAFEEWTIATQIHPVILLLMIRDAQSWNWVSRPPSPWSGLAQYSDADV